MHFWEERRAAAVKNTERIAKFASLRILCNLSTGVLYLHKQRVLIITVYVNSNADDRGSSRAYEYPRAFSPRPPLST